MLAPRSSRLDERPNMWKRLRFALMACLTGGLVAWLGLTNAAADIEGEAPAAYCTAMDYQAYLSLSNDRRLELAPAFKLEVAEQFLADCPRRIERPSVQRAAGRYALDAGDATRAAAHFEAADLAGAPFNRADRLDQMTALIATGQADFAWRIRDRAIADWLRRLNADGLSTHTTMRLRDGLVHHIVFDAVDPQQRQREIWMGVPYGAGWPAVISHGSDLRRIALLKLRRGAAAETLQHIDLVRCRGRETLVDREGAILPSEAKAAALTALKVYLRSPDIRYERRSEEDPVPACFGVERLFVTPDPRTAQPIW